MHDLLYTLNNLIAEIKEHQPFVLRVFVVLWVVNPVNWFLLQSRLNVLGIYPRTPFGLVGIVFSPIMHGNVTHLLFNSIPLYVLMNFILIKGYAVFVVVTAIIAVLGGFAVWLFGRKAMHIGASGVINGYFGYLLLQAVTHRSAMDWILILVSIYYFGGILSDLIPTKAQTSWEGHVFGFLSGFVAVYLAPIVLAG